MDKVEIKEKCFTEIDTMFGAKITSRHKPCVALQPESVVIMTTTCECNKELNAVPHVVRPINLVGEVEETKHGCWFGSHCSF